MGTIKLGSSRDRVGVTIDPRYVLFNGDDVKYIKSGSTEIWSYAQPLVPTMTSNTTPYGEVSASSYYYEYYPYMAFDNVTEFGKNGWVANTANLSWLQYKFTTPTNVARVSLVPRNDGGKSGVNNFIIQGSNNGTDFVDIYTGKCENIVKAYQTFSFDNNEYYLYYRIRILDGYSGISYIGIETLQYYGTQLRALIPIMASNTSSDGVASASSVLDNNATYSAYKVFDGNDNTGWLPIMWKTDNYVSFQFTKEKRVNLAMVKMTKASSATAVTLYIQGSNDGVEWHNLSEGQECSGSKTFLIPLNNDSPYIYYRLFSEKALTQNAGVYFTVSTFQLYK